MPLASMAAVAAPQFSPSVEPKPRTVAFVCLGDASDPHYSSGSPYGMRKGFLDIGCKVIDVFSIRPRREALLLPKRVLYRLFGRYYSGDRSPICLAAMGAEVARRLDGVDVDLIFAAHSIPLTAVRSSAPRVFSHDQSFTERISYVPYEKRPLAKHYVAQAIAQERRVFANASLAVYPSMRSIAAIMRDYGVPAEKLAMVPWGGILPSDPAPEAVEAMIRARPTDELRLTFVGVDWERKGGDAVLAASRLLAARGLNPAVTIIGSVPPGEVPGFVRVIPFLDKKDPEQLAAFLSILGRSHFLFVPSRAEAFGHVFCEAAAYGVPSVARDVGGIPTIIADGQTGHCLDEGATAEDFARAIARTMQDPEAYRAMARATRKRYDERLTWAAFARDVLAKVDALDAPG